MLISLLGLPGSGKSTLARALEKRLGAIYAHPGKFAVATGLIDNPFPQREELVAIANLTEKFLAHVKSALAQSVVVVDGFPRTREQARKLVETGWKMQVVHLVFPAGKETDMSVARQQKRVDDEGVADIVERSSLESQTSFAMEHDLGAVDQLRLLGVTVVEIDATQSVEAVLAQACAALNLQLDQRSDNDA